MMATHETLHMVAMEGQVQHRYHSGTTQGTTHAMMQHRVQHNTTHDQHLHLHLPIQPSYHHRYPTLPPSPSYLLCYPYHPHKHTTMHWVASIWQKMVALRTEGCVQGWEKGCGGGEEFGLQR